MLRNSKFQKRIQLEPVGRLVRAVPSADVFSVVPFLLIPYDSLTYLVRIDPNTTAQTLPATAIFSVIYLLFRGSNLRTSAASLRIFFLMLCAASVMSIVTLCNAFFEMAFTVDVDWLARVPAATRQALSMAFGLTTLLMYQDAFLRLSLATSMRWVIYGGIPSMLVGLAQFTDGAFRVQGFSSEPSHFADMIVFSFLPACAMAAVSVKYRSISAITGVSMLLATFSTTGYLKALFVIGSYFAIKGRLFLGLFVRSVLMGCGYFLISLFPENYVYLIFSFMQNNYSQTGELLTGSFIDRFFGMIGPLSMLDHWQAWFGFGFGGDTVYFNKVFEVDTANAIRETKGDLVSISSLQGKLLMYGGVIGYGLYLSVWLTAWAFVRHSNFLRTMLLSVFVASLFSLGPLFLPYTWLWLAAASASKTSDALRF